MVNWWNGVYARSYTHCRYLLFWIQSHSLMLRACSIFKQKHRISWCIYGMVVPVVAIITINIINIKARFICTYAIYIKYRSIIIIVGQPASQSAIDRYGQVVGGAFFTMHQFYCPSEIYCYYYHLFHFLYILFILLLSSSLSLSLKFSFKIENAFTIVINRSWMLPCCVDSIFIVSCVAMWIYHMVAFDRIFSHTNQ